LHSQSDIDLVFLNARRRLFGGRSKTRDKRALAFHARPFRNAAADLPREFA